MAFIKNDQTSIYKFMTSKMQRCGLINNHHIALIVSTVEQRCFQS